MGRLQDAIVRVFIHTDHRSTPHAVVMWVVNLSLTGSPAAGHTRTALDGSLSLRLSGGRGTSCVWVSLFRSGKSECASRERSLPVSLADPASPQSYVLLLESGAPMAAFQVWVHGGSIPSAQPGGRPHRSEAGSPPVLLCLWPLFILTVISRIWIFHRPNSKFII